MKYVKKIVFVPLLISLSLHSIHAAHNTRQENASVREEQTTESRHFSKSCCIAWGHELSFAKGSFSLNMSVPFDDGTNEHITLTLNTLGLDVGLGLTCGLAFFTGKFTRKQLTENELQLGTGYYIKPHALPIKKGPFFSYTGKGPLDETTGKRQSLDFPIDPLLLYIPFKKGNGGLIYLPLFNLSTTTLAYLIQWLMNKGWFFKGDSEGNLFEKGIAKLYSITEKITANPDETCATHYQSKFNTIHNAGIIAGGTITVEKERNVIKRSISSIVERIQGFFR